MERRKEFLEHRIARLERQAERRAARGLYPESIALLEEACRLSRQQVGERHGSAVSRLSQLAEYYRCIGDRERAAINYRRVATLQRRFEASDEVSLACTLNSLGVLRCEMGQYRQALRPFRQALKIARKHPSSDGFVPSSVANNLAGAHFCLGQYRPSEALYREALASFESLSQPPTLELLHCLCSLVELRELSGDREAALQFAHRARAAAQGATEIRNEDLAEDLALLADFFGRVEEFHIALSLVRESARLLEEEGRSCGEELLQCVERLARLSDESPAPRAEPKSEVQSRAKESDS